MLGIHACLHTEYIHGGDILLPIEHNLNRLTTPPMEHMLNGYDDSALNGVRLSLNFMKIILNSILPAQNVCDCRSYVSCNDYGVNECPTDFESYFNPCTQR